jgi:GNAT superfamily N-acetyltransferase
VLDIALATPADHQAIGAILDDAREWIAARGIAQWSRPFDDEWIAARIASGEFWVGRLAAEPVAVVRLLWADPVFWGERDDGAAAYLHTLAVRRGWHGQALGARLLDWAAGMARTTGRQTLRLDCMADNLALRRYYERAGFTPVAPSRLGDETVMLFEKVLLR